MVGEDVRRGCVKMVRRTGKGGSIAGERERGHTSNHRRRGVLRVDLYVLVGNGEDHLQLVADISLGGPVVATERHRDRQEWHTVLGRRLPTLPSSEECSSTSRIGRCTRPCCSARTAPCWRSGPGSCGTCYRDADPIPQTYFLWSFQFLSMHFTQQKEECSSLPYFRHVTHWQDKGTKLFPKSSPKMQRSELHIVRMLYLYQVIRRSLSENCNSSLVFLGIVMWGLMTISWIGWSTLQRIFVSSLREGARERTGYLISPVSPGRGEEFAFVSNASTISPSPIASSLSEARWSWSSIARSLLHYRAIFVDFNEDFSNQENKKKSFPWNSRRIDRHGWKFSFFLDYGWLVCLWVLKDRQKA